MLEAPPEDEHDQRDDTPRDRDAERAVLGACLLRPDTALEPVTLTVTADDFHDQPHRDIYSAILDLYARQRPVDSITVANQLGTNLRRVGGQSYLAELANVGIGVADPSYHARIVAEKAADRRLIEYHQRGIADVTMRGDAPADELYQRAADRLAAIPRGVPGVDERATSSWAPVDLAELRATGLERLHPTLLTVSDGTSLLYAGRTHSLSGESTTGKTWITLAGICQEIAAGCPVGFIDFEDRADSLLTRLHDMGADPDAVDALVRYIGPTQALTPGVWPTVEAATRDCRIVVIDGVTEAMTMHGWSLLDNEDIARWYDLLPRRIANLGPAVVEIDHVVKDKEARGRYAMGGAHKLNGITGAAYSVNLLKSFAVGQPGASRIVVAKDRHGGVGPVGHTAAEFRVAPDHHRHPEALDWALEPNNASFTATGRPRLTGYMQKISEFLALSPGSSKSAIYEAVRGKESHKDSAIQTLLEEAWIRTEPGPRNATFHYVVKPYREDEDEHAQPAA